MEFQKLGERNLTVAFLEPFYTTTHLIFGENRVYVCDTFLGPDSMKGITNIIKENGHKDKPIVVFNSHADWDHVWGNCYFEDAIILAHKESKLRMEKEWDQELLINREHQRGTVIQALPTVTFEDNYVFHDDEVEFFHTPGHTIDSSSCFDRKDKILIVGDNIESEVPHVNNLDFNIYISTLENYLALDWNFVVPGHDPIQRNASLIRSNLKYLRQLKEWKVDLTKLSETGLHVHFHTLKKLVNDILLRGVRPEMRNHFNQAISVLENRPPTAITQEYLTSFRKVTC